MERISWDELRTLLKEEFEELLTYIPQGDERVLFNKPETQGTVLAEISKLVQTYLHHHPKEKVVEIVQREGGLTATLCGNETITAWLYQHYVD